MLEYINLIQCRALYISSFHQLLLSCPNTLEILYCNGMLQLTDEYLNIFFHNHDYLFIN